MNRTKELIVKRVCLVVAMLHVLTTTLPAQLTIHIKATPPANKEIFIAGSFNRWNPGDQSYKLTKANDEYIISLPDSIRGDVEFKFTLGSWEAVELNSDGSGVPNRTFTIPQTGTATYSAIITTWQNPAALKPRAHTASKNVSVIDTAFVIPQLGRTRRIWVYTPPDYASSKKKYAVLYMHDGQNVFDNATSFAGEWGVDETLDSLSARGDRGVIVVGIDNGGAHRIPEYHPWKHPQYGGGEGDAYVDFLVKTLKPYIDAHYRTRPDRVNTAIAGSSMGGLISLYAALKYPNVFGKAVVFSPSLWIAPEMLAFAHTSQLPHPKLYFLSAQMESEPKDKTGAPQTSQRMMVDTLRALGFNEKLLIAKVRADGAHSEWFWRREFPAAYAWLFSR